MLYLHQNFEILILLIQEQLEIVSLVFSNVWTAHSSIICHKTLFNMIVIPHMIFLNCFYSCVNALKSFLIFCCMCNEINFVSEDSNGTDTNCKESLRMYIHRKAFRRKKHILENNFINVYLLTLPSFIINLLLICLYKLNASNLIS